MKKAYLSFIILILVLPGLVQAQQEEKFDVKIKPGFAIRSLPDNELTAIAAGKEILLVSNSTGVIKKELSGAKGTVIDLDVNQTGELLAASAESGECYVWELGSGRLLHTLLSDSKGLIGGRFVDDGLLATAGKDESIQLWDTGSGNLIKTIDDYPHGILSLDARKGLVATGDKKGAVVFRKIDQDSVLARLQLSGSITSITLDANLKKAFIGTDEGNIITYSFEQQAIVNQENNGRGQINHLAMASDNLHLVVAARDIKIYNTQNMELAMSFNKVASAVIAAAFTPDGDNLFFVEEFALKASCLDISGLDIAYGMNLKDASDKIPPQIYLSSPAKIVDNRVVNYENLLVLRGSVIDDYGVQELKINGIVTPVKENGNFVINIPLTMGDNFVTIEVTDINQNTALKKFVAVRKNMDGTAYDPSEATNYLLVIGINKYEYWPQLYNAVKDANDVVSTLLGMYDFEFANVTLITDEQATRSNLYNTLREFVNKVGPQDNFMIYYSGHGYFDELLNEGYWVPSDARLNQTGDFLSNSDISKIIGNIDSQHTFLVADACFSGSLFNESSRGYAENVEKFRSRWGLASGRLETVSDGAVGANSPFAQTFIRYLKTNNQDKIAISQLVQYVKVQVAEISDQTPIGNPLKGVGDEGGEFVLYKK